MHGFHLHALMGGLHHGQLDTFELYRSFDNVFLYTVHQVLQMQNELTLVGGVDHAVEQGLGFKCTLFVVIQQGVHALTAFL